MFTNSGQDSPKKKTQASLSPKGKGNEGTATKITAFCTFPQALINYQCFCVQTEGFSLILDEKLILTPTVPADVFNKENLRRKHEHL